MANLKQAIQELPGVYIFDNDDMEVPFRLAAVFQNGRPISAATKIPRWLAVDR